MYKHREPTNPRYKNFCQKFFTAGDEEQFQKSRDWSNNRSDENTVSQSVGECQTKMSFDIWNGHSNLTGDVITDTFHYIFHKFKKGIYIRIKDNKVITFLPFSKAKFTNEWGHRIKVDSSKYKSIIDFLKYVNTLEGRTFNERKVNKFQDEWYANNCLLRYEFPISEGDTGTEHMKSMFEDLCKNRKVPDLEFFINRRDFPLLKRDFTEPYDHIYDTDKQPLLSHKYEKYCPIFSSTTTDNFADISIPTLDDWARIKSREKIYFERTENRQYSGNFNTPWEKRKSIAVFRGGSTGVGVTIETNPRLKIAHLSNLSKKDSADNLPFLDAGITDWNLRPRKIKGQSFLQTIDIKNLPFALVPKLSPEQQSLYKYIVHIQGHVSAFRLSLELSMGSAILLVESTHKLWFQDFLKPYVHYIPVKNDLSDLYDRILWCKNNDEICKRIVANANIFFNTHLSKDGIFDYLQNLMHETKKVVGNYFYRTELQTQLQQERDWVLKNCLPRKDVVLGAVYQKTKNTPIYDHDTEIVKSTIDVDKKLELIREVYIWENGLKDIKDQSCFSKIRGITENEDVIYNKAKGKTLFDWLKTSFNITDFAHILAQISFALHQAQESCLFVHNDLLPWNVIISECKDGNKIMNEFNRDELFSYNVRVTPIIIDYGKSHIINKDYIHHGLINPYKFGSMHDMMCLVFSSVSILLKERKLTHEDEHFFEDVINHFFLQTKMYSAKLRHFIHTHSSFSILSSLNMTNGKYMVDFIKYIATKYSTFQIRKEMFPIFSPISNKKITRTIDNLTFRNKISVYLFFQMLNNPYMEPIFEKILKNTHNYVSENMTAINAPICLDDEIYLNTPKMKNIVSELTHDYDILICEKEKMHEMLHVRGIFKVKDDDRSVFESHSKINICNLKHALANKCTLDIFLKV